MPDPACDVAAGRVVMRPVHDAAFVVLLELPSKRNGIAF
jgi:hypothetical protein